MTTATTQRLLAAIGRLHQGERDEARVQLIALNAELAVDDWFHRCVLAHYLADAHDAPEDALRWDEVALQAAQQATAADFDERFPGTTLGSFFPSLHLNLAAGLEQLGRVEEARAQAELAHRAVAALPATPLAQLTRDAIARLRERLEAR